MNYSVPHSLLLIALSSFPFSFSSSSGPSLLPSSHHSSNHHCLLPAAPFLSLPPHCLSCPLSSLLNPPLMPSTPPSPFCLPLSSAHSAAATVLGSSSGGLGLEDVYARVLGGAGISRLSGPIPVPTCSEGVEEEAEDEEEEEEEGRARR